MSLHGVERLLHRMNKDPEIGGAFMADRASVVSMYGLGITDDERRFLIDGDLLSLYRLGVHPLLLAPASRFFGMDQRAFKETLAVAVGERRS
jgi:hypothetical protein